MALTSPGVQVSVIDESFYTPAEPGTVPMIFVATASNKTNGAGTATAAGTIAANVGIPYLLTSQRDLVDTFGDPVFYTDASNNPIHGGELNEYGLQAAYSYLGVANRAWVVRADVDLGSLQASASAPAGEAVDNSYWFDIVNTKFGIFEWNSAAASTTGGQSFTNKVPLVISSTAQVTGNAPKTSVGAIGDYAVVATNTSNRLYYKKYDGSWVQVGSSDWASAHPTIVGAAAPTPVTGTTLEINGTTVTVSGTNVTAIYNAIQAAVDAEDLPGITVRLVGTTIQLYSDGTTESGGVGSGVDGGINITSGTGLASTFGFVEGTFYAPAVAINKHTNVPEFKTNDTTPRPSGSVWIKTTEPNLGARWRVKEYNATTGLWEEQSVPMYASATAAMADLDSTGGRTLGVGTLFVQYNITEEVNPLVDFKIYRRSVLGATSVTGSIVTTQVPAGSASFTIQESLAGNATISSAVTVTFTATGAASDADVIAGAVNSAGLVNVVASVGADNKVTLTHSNGGEMILVDTDGVLDDIGITAGTVSNWSVLSYEASDDAPSSLTADGTLWYSSVVDEVDIMAHNGTTWVGYKTLYSSTNAAGPTVSASAPTSPVENDLWIDTSDLENYPTIYRYNAAAVWELVDKSDQTTENGILFADARWALSGDAEDAADIADLLTSAYLDTDAPDPALYPRGMLLWNLRRSGFNVKRFERNWVDVNADNIRNGDESMTSYYPHRWVTESANQDDGSGSFGRKAQRKVVVQAMQAAINSNDNIRDEEARVFNLIAAPGYPELIGEMITLNTDRGLTAFVVGDSPARLTPDATSLNNWGANVALAVEDNDSGLVSRDEYMGVYYPWGFTSDNFGNNVVVPPSHMMLRTMALSDQVSYPWFAPAGTRRGGISNATSVGYIDAEGEFRSISLNEGQRDTLYQNAINPITFITGAGLVAFGQKTRARSASSLDRINVARLVVYLRRQLNALAKPFIFEPNDTITRDAIKAQVESLMLDLISQRAIGDYIVVCDETNNTPARIDRNELYVDIAIEPIKAVEFIYIPLRLKNTGEIAGL